MLLALPYWSIYLPLVTQIRGHIAGTSPTSPLRTVHAFVCISGGLQLFFVALVVWRLIVHAHTLGAFCSQFVRQKESLPRGDWNS